MRCGMVVSRPDCPTADRPLGNSVGAIEWSPGGRLRSRGRPLLAGISPRVRSPTLVTLRPPGGFPGAHPLWGRAWV